MGKQSRSKKPEVLGKGKVTPVQIAFIVDRYLSDNGYSSTRSTFRSEASNLIAKSPVHEAPKTLLSLGAILDEYITLKEQKVSMDQERHRLEQDKLRIQNLLSGMQDVMNAYNSSGNSVVTPPPPIPPPVAPGSMISPAERSVATSSDYDPAHSNPAIMSTSKTLNVQKDSTTFSTPMMYNGIRKRKGLKDVSDGPVVSKRSRRCTLPKDANLASQMSKHTAGKNQVNNTPIRSAAVQSSACDIAPKGSPPVQGYNVVKCLFNQEPDPSSSPANYSLPKTPPPASSQTGISTSPLEMCSTTTSTNDVAQKVVSANRTIISSETIRVSPNKQISYYTIEKNHITTCSPIKTSFKRSSNLKDHVRGRLDFGPSEMPVIAEKQTSECNTTSESEKEGDFLDYDFSNLDFFGLDSNLSELLVDFGIDNDGLGLYPEQVMNSSPESNSRSSPIPENVEMDTRQVNSQFSSTMPSLGEEDMNLIGTESIEASRSVTKCIRIVSPVKSQRSKFHSGE